MSGTRAWFITGTDTEIGKTFVACALLLKTSKCMCGHRPS